MTREDVARMWLEKGGFIGVNRMNPREFIWCEAQYQLAAPGFMNVQFSPGAASGFLDTLITLREQQKTQGIG